MPEPTREGHKRRSWWYSPVDRMWPFTRLLVALACVALAFVVDDRVSAYVVGSAWGVLLTILGDAVVTWTVRAR